MGVRLRVTESKGRGAGLVGVGVRVSIRIYIGGGSGLVWASGLGLIIEAVELECPPQLMIYRGGCIRMLISVNIY